MTGLAARTAVTPDRAPAPVLRKPRFRADVQGLRGVAVLLVIGEHAGLPGFSGGFIGVDIFFVISGYVITNLLLREQEKGLRQGLADFYARRIRRIAPAASATLVVTVLAARLTLGDRFDPTLAGDVRWASVFLANFRLTATGTDYFVPGVHPSLVTQFWSLAVEEQFYLLFPLVVFLVARSVGPERRRRTLTLVLTGSVAASAGWSVLATATQPTSAYYSPFTRFWELGLGGLLAVTSSGRVIRTVRSDRVAAVVGSALILAALATLGSSRDYPGGQAWLPCAGAALVIWAGSAGERTLLTRTLARPPLRYLGDISYSLYLVHYAWLNLPGQLASPRTGWSWRAVELAGTFTTAACSYHLLEDPIRRSKRLAGDRGATFLVLVLCVTAVWTAARLAAA